MIKRKEGKAGSFVGASQSGGIARLSLVLLVASAIASGAPSAALGSSHLSAPLLIDPSFAPLSVSCPSATFCAAVGSGSAGFAEGAEAIYDNGSWGKPSLIDPGAYLGEVSCASSSFCLALDSSGALLTYDGGSWSAPTQVDDGEQISSIACPSSSFCVAVDHSGRALTYDGSSWSAPTMVMPGGELWELSCPSTSFCMAIAEPHREAGAQFRPEEVTFNGSTWSAPVPLEGESLLPQLSCVSASFCAVVDYGGNAITYDGSSWSAPTRIDPSGEVHNLACASASFCIASDERGNVTRYTGTSWSEPARTALSGAISCPTVTFCMTVDQGQVATFDGSTWSPPSAFAGDGLEADSCPGAGFCAAVGENGEALTYDGEGWSEPAFVDPHARLEAVSCVSAYFCAAVDRSGYALTYDGGSWSEPLATGLGPGTDVSCASFAFCVAIDESGHASTYDGHSWSAPVAIDSTSPLYAIACPLASVCVAVDGAGNALTYNGKSWSAPALADPESSLSAISCPSPSFCMASGAEDHGLPFAPRPKDEVTFNGESWSTPTPLPSFIHEVSCSSPELCVAVGDNSEVSVFDGSSWSELWPVPSEGPTGVACAPESFCTVVDDRGQALTYRASSIPPAASSPPTIAGEPVVGRSLIESHALWSGLPSIYFYRWGRCGRQGGHCDYGYEDVSTYRLSDNDRGYTLRVEEYALDGEGTGGPAISAPTCVVREESETSLHPECPPRESPPPSPPVESEPPRGGEGSGSIQLQAGLQRGMPKVEIGLAVAYARGARPHARRGVLEVPLTCTGSPASSCAVTLRLSVVETSAREHLLSIARSKSRTSRAVRRTLVLGSRKVTLAGESSRTVRLSLNWVGRALVRDRALTATLGISQPGAAPARMKVHL